MGAQDYEERVVGFETAEEAFSDVTRQARYMHGHGGYSGTIAEKSDFIMIKVPDGKDPIAYANHLLDSGDSRANDKWGPACCVEFKDKDGKKGFYFFGWASS